ncbi:hypothetical protein CHLNCDRAFT_145153 [Chlorella variabilis]|uniref:RNA polymerase Rpb4/RPC9 core domain-containing protein n=1 Tax=Chlorella variabilis TaxID=554065 RepID=E1ZCQ2_CHLVA|nr:hypothetical protein CHLNCDRAFT_145153 [Chlorella variabilis]EFN56279.1 hypothetical protein CHLNCDRAFT_145153 [Chlorella variabilis]|eukprot:XP_005848381.1 hypothetical protein CHLNCDRAFT_145153 [Chlorella variabilis]
MPAKVDDEVLGDKDIKVLTISEVACLIDEYVKGTQQRDADYQPNPMLVKAAEYASRFATNKNRDTLQKIREVIAHNQLSELELGLVANLSIETADEARKLVPTLDDRDRFPDDATLDALLKELATYREFE